MTQTATVLNLATGRETLYTTDPRSAVIAAYAQSRLDFNTWSYQERYAQLVTFGPSGRTVACGNYAARLA